jgi:hypothetical protein
VPICKNNYKLLQFFLSLLFDLIRESASTALTALSNVDYRLTACIG